MGQIATRMPTVTLRQFVNTQVVPVKGRSAVLLDNKGTCTRMLLIGSVSLNTQNSFMCLSSC